MKKYSLLLMSLLMLCTAPMWVYGVKIGGDESAFPECNCADGETIPFFLIPGVEIPGFTSACTGSVLSLQKCYASHPTEVCDAYCTANGHIAPEPDPEPEPEENSNVPSLEHWELVENTYAANEINFTFAPKGAQQFYLHVNLKFENGRDVLSAWCTGDEKLCKAVGNGQACSGTDYTGTNAWCYQAD